MNAIEWRLARPADGGRIAALHVESWRAAYRGIRVAEEAVKPLPGGVRVASLRYVWEDLERLGSPTVEVFPSESP